MQFHGENIGKQAGGKIAKLNSYKQRVEIGVEAEPETNKLARRKKEKSSNGGVSSSRSNVSEALVGPNWKHT